MSASLLSLLVWKVLGKEYGRDPICCSIFTPNAAAASGAPLASSAGFPVIDSPAHSFVLRIFLEQSSMNRVLLLALVVLCLFSMSSVAQQPSASPRPITIADYFQIREVHDPQISPDARWVAYTVTSPNVEKDKSESRIWMVASSGGEAIALTSESVSSSHARWSPDGKWLAFLSARDEGKTQVWLLNRLGGEAQKLTDTPQDVNDFVWSPDSTRLALVLRDPTDEELDAAKTNKDKSPDPSDAGKSKK